MKRISSHISNLMSRRGEIESIERHEPTVVRWRGLENYGRPSNGRSGFTLLETMLALSLAGLLLAGVYAAIEQSWRMSSSGREEMERAQLARALIHKMEIDIRSITFIAPPPVDESATASTTTTTSSPSSSGGSSGGSGGSSSGGSSGSGGNSSGSKSGSGSGSSGSGGGAKSGSGGSSSGSGSSKSSGGSSGGSSASGSGSGSSSSSSSSSSTDTSTTDPPVPNSKSIGIRGTNLQLEMSISRPRQDLLPGTSAVAGLSGTSDLRAVTYSFVAPGSSPMSGLVRTEGDRMAVEAVEANGGVATQISNGQMLAPEVSALTFRYFDGRVWSTEWDSETNGRIPRAVEIQIVFAQPVRKKSFFSPAVSHSMDAFRTVILIPVSDPFPAEFLE